MPNDFRYNQWDDVATPVALKELHVIPMVSPFVVRLNEVPARSDPSSVVVKYVPDIVDSIKVYGDTLTEVAEVPAAGQFRPDYNTGACKDKNWNTGTLLFNAVDAGKLVEVSYQGSGTLASVKAPSYPSWWLDRGDGSDGDFAPTANCTISGLKQYKSVYIPKGVTVTVEGFVRICCQGAFVNKGTITADGKGASGGSCGSVNWEGTITSLATAGGNSCLGGAGGKGCTITGNYTAPGAPGGAGSYFQGRSLTVASATDMLTILQGFAFGAGGGGAGQYGTGGAGGGAISIVAKYFYNANGIITSKGSNGITSNTKGGGGGGGGTIIVICQTNIGTGPLQVNGGAGGTGAASGSAGIAIIKELGV